MGDDLQTLASTSTHDDSRAGPRPGKPVHGPARLNRVLTCAPPPTTRLVHSQEASLPSAGRCQATSPVPPSWFFATSTAYSETGVRVDPLPAGVRHLRPPTHERVRPPATHTPSKAVSSAATHSTPERMCLDVPAAGAAGALLARTPVPRGPHQSTTSPAAASDRWCVWCATAPMGRHRWERAMERAVPEDSAVLDRLFSWCSRVRVQHLWKRTRRDRPRGAAPGNSHFPPAPRGWPGCGPGTITLPDRHRPRPGLAPHADWNSGLRGRSARGRGQHCLSDFRSCSTRTPGNARSVG